MKGRIRLTSLAVLLLTAACGGNDERLTQPAFIQQGDAICAEYNEKRAEVERRFPLTVDPTSPEATDEHVKQFGRSVPEQVEIGRAQLADLRDLQPPETLEDEWNGAAGDLEQGFLRFEEAGEAARELDRERLEPALREAIAKFDAANTVARTIGFHVCGADEEPR